MTKARDIEVNPGPDHVLEVNDNDLPGSTLIEHPNYDTHQQKEIRKMSKEANNIVKMVLVIVIFMMIIGLSRAWNINYGETNALPFKNKPSTPCWMFGNANKTSFEIHNITVYANSPHYYFLIPQNMAVPRRFATRINETE